MLCLRDQLVQWHLIGQWVPWCLYFRWDRYDLWHLYFLLNPVVQCDLWVLWPLYLWQFLLARWVLWLPCRLWVPCHLWPLSHR